MNKNNFDPENQCELSYQLLYLLRWLAEYETPALKKLVTHAVQQGLGHYLTQSDSVMNGKDNNLLQTSIIDFLDLLDAILHETLNEHNMQKALQQNLMPSVHKIDSNVCGSSTLLSSLEKTTARLEQQPKANAQELLYKEILRQWKPSKKRLMN